MNIKLNKPFAANSAVDEFDVKQIKKALNRLGYYQPYEKTGITGILDAGVFSALKSFQKDQGLQPTGTARPGDETVSKLSSEAGKKKSGKYQQMRESGEPYGTDNFEGKEWYSLMGDLDRRALYAVASNESDLFSKEEQTTARDIMLGQTGMAMGLYSGPTRLAGEFTALPATSNADHMRKYKAGIEYMDRVSIEEKATSVEWARQRASMQLGYEDSARDEGMIPKVFNIDHPLVNLILGALESSPGYTSDMDISSRKELLDGPWFKGYEDRLDSVMAKTRELYGVKNS